ncbi:Gfo/Idh/MocA family oxidoreductase [Mesorhizobium sp. M7A.F.Ca.CA.001.07.2.1]|uniref:Gfo/Idh/MocA family protein n=3 Tax=Phyllobacteriaceae TaxID=69277 RepID=UPI000FC9FD87|nr:MULTISPECIES: Gfo/Idh/MocA family oxidoreductase [Mesorhizobium]MCF6125305.1 Gfo/Idh/MocA family oxidoreductase [Mesorhizobium ciceri]MCQ8814672.1 Gfo/Idh/MocA family oxidoreductase [Mesorhizobium sp. SEMIA396]RUX81858.1 Gfo/Idh/MocA family oxidoreductase [Mesorhizobium sp. M7A.F.Ca.CA.004.08.2.1]RUX89621.1 Gfo/Idh/MocA family oxidoreductase [Mesorhizobium sp. M7A.F.Ca.CA.004.08.1.1]RUY07487.1 Gfo/Idh/MocA family oxidoreductase [Mesorhizobium sp. M7A.F.Ca.CA.004.04.1.1]
MAELRGALIGCGFFAVNQMHAWRDIAGASIVAICDRDPERLRIVGDQFGIAKRYTDAGELFAGENLDFVDIATSAPSHRPLVEMAAQHRVPVICQKPFAPTLADAKAMVGACAEAGVPLMVHENFRWQSPIQAVRAVLDSGEIGMPFFGRISFRSAYDVFSGQPYLATGRRFIIEDLGIHILDIARFLLGDVSTITTRTVRINPGISGEDVATMLMDHNSGATSVVDCSYATKLATEPFPETLIEIDGSDGTIRLAQGYRLTVTGKSGTAVTDVSPPLLPWASRPWHNIQESVVAIQQHWVDCLAKGVQPATSGADNLKTFALVEAAYAGAASRQPVQLDASLK